MDDCSTKDAENGLKPMDPRPLPPNEMRGRAGERRENFMVFRG